MLCYLRVLNTDYFYFYRSHQISDPQIQSILSKTRLPKRPKRPLDPKVLNLLMEPELPLTPPPEAPEKEMVDLDLAATEE